MSDISIFHKNAKDAGNRLSAFITTSSIGAVAVYFVALIQGQAKFSVLEQWFLITALLLFVVTFILRCLELHLDAQRFYLTAAQLAKPEHFQDWRSKDKKQALRLQVIWWSYYTFGYALLFSVFIMVSRII